MQARDYSPTSSPTSAEQTDALRKGLGRAMQWAIAGRLDRELLSAACLRDERFDQQIESSRGDWLWGLIQTLDAIDRFREPLFRAITELADERSANQLCELAAKYAKMGDESFRKRLYKIVEQKPIADSPWIGESELLELDGEEGFLFIVRSRGKSLATREWDWDDQSIISCASERFGKERVAQLLLHADEHDIDTFRQCWLNEQKKTDEQQTKLSQRERMRAMTLADVIARCESGKPAYGIFRGWGMHAEVAELQSILERMWTADQPSVLTNLLSVFSNRVLPEFDDRLIGLCQNDDDTVKRRAYAVVANHAHPLIRQFALKQLEIGLRFGSQVSLFINNYQAGDERRILETIDLPADENDLHWLLMDVRKVLEKNPTADSADLGVLAYALTPCGECRYSAVDLLQKQGGVPQWLRDECRHDSIKDCRKLFDPAREATGRI